MKRIICTVTNDLNHDQRMIRICGSLKKAGYEVMLVGRVKADSKEITERPFDQKRLRLRFQKGKLFYLEYNLRLFFFLLFSKFDIICSVDLDTVLPGFLVSRLKGKTCVYDAHEFFTELPEVVERPFVKRSWEAVGKFVIPRLQHAYTVGESLSRALFDKYGTDFSVIRNVPLRKQFVASMDKKEEPFVLLYQGVLNEGRGLEEMIDAMQDLDGTRFLLAGEGDLSEKLRQMVFL